MRFVRNLLATGMAAAALTAVTQAQPIVDAEGDGAYGTLAPDPSSILELQSTSKGFLTPRMTTAQRNLIASPAAGLLIYNLDNQQFEYWDGVLLAWIPVGAASGPYWLLTGNLALTEYDGSGPGGGTNYIGTNDATDMSIVTQNANNIDFWTNNTERFSVDGATGDIVPTNNNDIALGTNTNRFSEVYVDGSSVHIGPSGGEGVSEMELGYGLGGGTINVDGGAPEITIDGSIPFVAIDAAGDGMPDFGIDGTGMNAAFDVTNNGNMEFWIDPLGSFFPAGVGIDGNDDGIPDLGVMAPSGDVIITTNASVGGNTDITGNLDVDGTSTLGDGTDLTTINGPVTQTGAGNTVNFAGNVNANNGLDVTGLTTMTGAVTQSAGQVTFGGNVDANSGLDVSGANLTVAPGVILDAQGSGNQIGNGAGGTQLTVQGDGAANPGNGYELVVEGDAEVQGTLGLTNLTDGSVLFIENSGQVSEDNGNFFWDDASNELGIGTNTPSAALDIVQSGGFDPALEVNQSGGITNAAEINGSGIIGNVLSISGAGSIGDGINVSSPAIGTGITVNGPLSGDGVVVNVSGGDGLVINETSTNDGIVINESSSGNGLQVNAGGTGFGIDLNGGALDGDAAGNALGSGAAAQQLTVRGSANAVIGNTLGAQPTVWDLVVQGDAVATGMIKVGGSMWLDGTSATHQLNTNAPLLVATSAGNIEIDAAGGTTTIDDNLVVAGTVNQTGGGQVTFSGNVDANNGVDVLGGNLNVTNNANVTGNLDVDGATTLDGTTVDGSLTNNVGPANFNGALNANAGGSMAGTFTGSPTFNGNPTFTNINVDGGTVDGTVIGGASPAAGSFTTLNASGGGSLGGTFTGSPSFTGNPSFSNIDVNGGTIDGTTIGGASAAAGTFTALTANNAITGNAAGNVIGNNTNATQLTIDGVPGVGAYELVVDGDVQINGAINFAGGFTLGSDLDMNGNDIVDNTDNEVSVDDNFLVTGDMNVQGTATINQLTVTNQTTSGTLTVGGVSNFNGNATFGGTGTFNGVTTFNASSTWSSGNNVTLANGTLAANKTAAGSAVTINNTNATNAIAINVANGGGRTILSAGGPAAGAIPTDVTVFAANGNVTLPTSTENGQILFVANTTGVAITVNGGAFGNIPAGQMRSYVYAGAWYEQQ